MSCKTCEQSGAKPGGVTWNGPARWAMLHRRALAYRGDAEGERAYLARLLERLPCDECREHFAALMADYPPDLTSAEAYFEWSHTMHRLVNDRLGKPSPTLDEARRLWSD